MSSVGVALAKVMRLTTEDMRTLLDPKLHISSTHFEFTDVPYDEAARGHKYGISVVLDEDGHIPVINGFVDVEVFPACGPGAEASSTGSGDKAFVLFPSTENPRVMPPMRRDDTRPLRVEDFVSEDVKSFVITKVFELFGSKIGGDFPFECIVNAVLMNVVGERMGDDEKTAFERVFDKEIPTTMSMHVNDIKEMAKQGPAVFVDYTTRC